MTGRAVAFLAERKYIVYILFVLCTITTLLLTLLPPENFENRSVFQYDKLGHFLIFFGWTLLFGFSWLIRKKKILNLWIIFIIGALFGIGIELAQGLLPYDRSPNVYDAIADIAGSYAAVLCLGYLQNRYHSYINDHYK